MIQNCGIDFEPGSSPKLSVNRACLESITRCMLQWSTPANHQLALPISSGIENKKNDNNEEYRFQLAICGRRRK
jgi:hypothetical protein